MNGRKRSVAFFMALLLLTFSLISCSEVSSTTNADDPSSGINDDFTLSGETTAPDGTPSGNPKYGVKVQYTCSPVGSGTIVGTGTQYIKSGGYTELVTAVPLYGYRFIGWSDGHETRSRTADSVTSDTVYTALFEKIEVSANITVPNFYLTTDSGNSIKSKNYVGGNLTIEGASKEKYNLTNLDLNVKGRGNSTWQTTYIDKVVGTDRWSSTNNKYETVDEELSYSSKNSYTIKLSEGQNLLGIGNGKNKDWILQANKYDPSMLKNVFMWTLAGRMGTLGWVTHYAWVNLYVNGEYRGLYMLIEKVEACNDRVVLDDSGTDPDKGYLLELDFRVDKDPTKKEGIDYFTIPEFKKNETNKREFDILSEHSTEEECSFIRDYMIKVDAAIRTHDKNKIAELVDLHSMVDIFIIEELGKDCDWGATSFYMYKEKRGKLYFTSPWDYDFCFGSYSTALSELKLVSEGSGGNDWFSELYNVDWFVDMVRARMNSLEDDLNESLDIMYKYALALAPYVAQNEERWNIFGLQYHYFVSKEVSELLYSYDEHVSFVHEWILYRWIELRRYYPEKTISSSPFK